MENPKFGKRFSNCCQIHWNGWFYFISPLVLLPLAFVEPHVECRTIFLMLWSLIWYIADCVPVGIIGIMPIIFLPLLGIMASLDSCMAYARDSQMVLMFSFFIAATIEYSKLDKKLAHCVLEKMSCNPKIILINLMLPSFILSIFIADAMVCALMIPLVKGILQILDNISIAKTIDESKEPKDDEKPFNSKVANAFYIGIAYAVNMGGMVTVRSSEAGLALEELVRDTLPKSTLERDLFGKHFLLTLPLSVLLLLFTIVYLEFVFLGLWRRGSKAAQEIIFDKEASKSALATLKDELPSYNVHMLMTLILYGIMMIMVAVVAYTGQEINGRILKYSFNAMLLCFLYFVLPNNFDFCNYFICKKPSEYKTAPSMLTWPVANKAMPWNYFFVYGSSLAFGLAMKTSGVYKYLGQAFLNTKGILIKQLGLMGLTILLTILGANHLVAEFMLKLGAQAALQADEAPALIMFPILWASSISFLLPVSSVANCFAGGWANLRSKDVILAGLGPTIFGLMLALIFCLVSNVVPYMLEKAY